MAHEQLNEWVQTAEVLLGRNKTVCITVAIDWYALLCISPDYHRLTAIKGHMELFSYLPMQKYCSALSIRTRGRKWSQLKPRVQQTLWRTGLTDTHINILNLWTTLIAVQLENVLVPCVCHSLCICLPSPTQALLPNLSFQYIIKLKCGCNIITTHYTRLFEFLRQKF